MDGRGSPRRWCGPDTVLTAPGDLARLCVRSGVCLCMEPCFEMVVVLFFSLCVLCDAGISTDRFLALVIHAYVHILSRSSSSARVPLISSAGSTPIYAYMHESMYIRTFIDTHTDIHVYIPTHTQKYTYIRI